MRRIALFFVFTTVCHGFAVEGPQNTFAAVGQAVSLKCRVPNGSIVESWSFKRQNTEENARVIFTTLGRQPTTYCQRCSVTGDQNGFSVLSFDAATLGDGGSYICDIERDGKIARYGAELIVSDTKSLKTSDKTISDVIMEGNYLEILCNFSFAGNMFPVVKWFRKSGRIALPLRQENNYVDGIHWFNFKTTLQLNASDNGIVFGYEVDFERSNTTNSTQPRFIQATNTLSNVFNWTFTAVVWRMPRNIQIEPVKAIYYFGDRVECSADGNPSPNFTWSCDVGTTREGSVLTLDADTFEVDVNYACQCTATSSIFCTNASETVIIRIAHETEWTTYIFIVVGVLAAVLTMIVLYFKGFLCCAANNYPDVVQHEDHSKTQAAEAADTSKKSAEIPVYGEVRKPLTESAAAADTSKKSAEIPVYGEVRKPLTGPSGLKTEKRRPEATANRISCNADKEDTVIYLDLKGGRSKVSKSPPVALATMSQTAMFNQSEYAAIDHALQPPPLKKRNN